ncbi:MAG: Gfo/Idh/MocA family oxidoreductase [Spirochaetia bacterium]|jgi:myo-inositol 2-dehydrogenase/D-chiro-inositol 1-dehydrogenase|nr:Gfo/Idh/MocA family oxidoreductase [Spirochaetia bacterium]
MIGIGLIGTGAMGAQHARDIAKMAGAQIVAIADPNKKSVEELANDLGNIKQFTDGNELIDDKAIDAVIVASPDRFHAGYVLKALLKGKFVFCEKPLADTPDEAWKIVEAEKNTGKHLVSVGFNRRFDPRHLAVKEKVDSQFYGRPLLWKGFHHNASAMYDTDGCFILNNSAGHDVDSASWILGSHVRAVNVKGLRSHENLDKDARDLLVVNMEMENGTLAVAEVYVNCRYGYEVGLDVVCQDGVISFQPKELVTIRHSDSNSLLMSDDFRGYFIESYRTEMEKWIESMEKGIRFPGASAYDGYLAIATTFAAGKSLISGKPVEVKPRELEEI